VDESFPCCKTDRTNTVGLSVNSTKDLYFDGLNLFYMEFGVIVSNSDNFTLIYSNVTDTSKYAVIFNNNTINSLLESCDIFDHQGRGVLIGDGAEFEIVNINNPSFTVDDDDNVTETNNTVSSCIFRGVAGFNLLLSHTSNTTTVTRCNFWTRSMKNLLEWSCIFVYNSHGNLITGNTIENVPDYSKMYVGIMVFSTQETMRNGDISQTVVSQNFIKLFTEGYAIHVFPLHSAPVQICASNIVSDTPYSTPSNAPLIWSC